jgi:hypothetical protein
MAPETIAWQRTSGSDVLSCGEIDCIRTINCHHPVHTKALTHQPAIWSRQDGTETISILLAAAATNQKADIPETVSETEHRSMPTNDEFQMLPKSSLSSR